MEKILEILGMSYFIVGSFATISSLPQQFSHIMEICTDDDFIQVDIFYHNKGLETKANITFLISISW
jgi:hypothetical protein